MVQLVVLMVFVLMFVNVSMGSIDLGTCSCSCNQNEHEAHDLLGMEKAQGVPGKKGPAGPEGPQGPRGHRGEQGPSGTACDCSDNDQLRRKLHEMQTEIDALKAFTRLTNGWTKASNGFHYKHFGHEKVNYETAKSRCADLGARLAAAGLRTAALRSEIRAYFSTSFRDTWIGLDDLVQQGTYVWSDGVVSTRTNTDWRQGQPSDAPERCSLMHGPFNGQVADYHCSSGQNYLCESLP